MPLSVPYIKFKDFDLKCHCQRTLYYSHHQQHNFTYCFKQLFCCYLDKIDADFYISKAKQGWKCQSLKVPFLNRQGVVFCPLSAYFHTLVRQYCLCNSYSQLQCLGILQAFQPKAWWLLFEMRQSLILPAAPVGVQGWRQRSASSRVTYQKISPASCVCRAPARRSIDMSIAVSLPWGKEKKNHISRINGNVIWMTFYVVRDRKKNSYIYESTQPTGFCLFLTRCNIILIFTVQSYGFDKISFFFFFFRQSKENLSFLLNTGMSKSI